jgi:hypothetical protein
MEGALTDGIPVRWWYDEFGAESFHYTAERLYNDTTSGKVYLELFGSRVSASATSPEIGSATHLRSFDFWAAGTSSIGRVIYNSV